MSHKDILNKIHNNRQMKLLFRKMLIILYAVVALIIVNAVFNGTNKNIANILAVFAIVIAIFPQLHYVSNRNIIKYILCFTSAALIPFWGIVIYSLIFLTVILRTAFVSYKRDKHVIFDLKKETGINYPNGLKSVYDQMSIKEFYKILDTQNSKIILIKQNAITGDWEQAEAWLEDSSLHVTGNEKHVEKVCAAIIGNRRAKIIADLAEYT